jgi:hypothetical protein
MLWACFDVSLPILGLFMLWCFFAKWVFNEEILLEKIWILRMASDLVRCSITLLSLTMLEKGPLEEKTVLNDYATTTKTVHNDSFSVVF